MQTVFKYLPKVGFVLLLTVVMVSCKKKEVPQVQYADEMRQFVQEISAYSKGANADFMIVPQNGAKLITQSRQQDGVLALDYLAAIDGQGQEELFYGYQKDNKATPKIISNELVYYLDLLEANNVEVLVTDYCSSPENVLDCFEKNEANGYVGFAADERNLTNIPDYLVNVHNENDADISTLADAKNFLYLINPSEEFSNKADFIAQVQATNYDVILIDKDFDQTPFTATEIDALKTKENGGSRLVLAYMSIGEAEDYRSYWKSDWTKKANQPAWLYKENRKWRGNYKVFYWMPEWKEIIYGSDAAYLDQILGANFDGTYLDIIDAYEYYEDLR